MLLLSRDLATIRQDLDIDTNLDKLKPGPSDLDVLRGIYEELELKRLLETLADVEEPVPDSKPEFEAILSEKQFSKWLKKINAAKLVGFDTETTSINYMEAELVGLSFAVGDGDAAYLPVAHVGIAAQY
jgi:DNA polymerase-1